MSVERITKWLREHGESHDHGSAFTYEVKDEPWMEFSAELQDWSFSKEGREILMIGYYFQQNGDLCPDPELTITIQDGEVEKVSYVHWTGMKHDATNDAYVPEFADLVWKRHLQDRPETADIKPSTTMSENTETQERTQL